MRFFLPYVICCGPPKATNRVVPAVWEDSLLFCACKQCRGTLHHKKSYSTHVSESHPEAQSENKEGNLLPVCGNRVHLWRAAEYASMTIFVTPEMIGFLNAELEDLACTTSRVLDTTSHVTGAVRQELSQVRKASGELQAMVDYLLLRQSHGCEQFNSTHIHYYGLFVLS